MTATKTIESGKLGKPAESTRTVGAVTTNRRQAESTPLTSEGVTSLLMSEFAETPEKPAGEKVQPAGDGKVTQKITKAPEGEVEQEQTEAAETPEEKTAREEPEAEPEAERLANETPEEKEARETAEAEALANETPEQRAAREEQEAEAEAERGQQVPPELQAAIEEWEGRGGELPTALQGLVDRRIGKLTGQRETEKTRADQAEARATALETELAEARVDGNGSRGATSPTTDLKALNQLESVSRRFVEDAENFLDETATAEEQARVERYLESERMDANGLKRRLREVNTFLQTVPETRRQAQAFQAEEAKLEPIAKAHFPFLFDKSSPDYAEAQSVLAVMPELRGRTPAHRFAVGVYILGLKEYRKLHPEVVGNGKSQMANGKVPAAKVPAKVPPKTPAAAGAAAPATRVNGKNAAEESRRQEFERNPTRESVTELVKSALRG